MTQTTTTPTQFWTVDEFNELLLSNINSMTPLQREQVLVYAADLNEAAATNQDKHITLDTLMSLATGARTLVLATRATGVSVATAPTTIELNDSVTAIAGAATVYSAKQGDTAIARYTDESTLVELWQYRGAAWSLVTSLRDGIDTAFVTATGTIGAAQGKQSSLIYANRTASTYTLTPDAGMIFAGIEAVSTFDATFDSTFASTGNSLTLGPDESAQFYRDGLTMRLQWVYPQRTVSGSSSSGVTLQDEGVTVGSNITTINVVGTGIATTVSGSTATITLTGGASSAGQQFAFTQAVPAISWNVNHSLNAVVDSVNVYVGGRKVYADVQIVDSNSLVITFSVAQSGVAIIES
jgi:hypothetical protein